MNDDRDLERIEQLLRQAAADVREAYPPTPPIAVSVRRQLQAHRRAPLRQPRLRLLFRAAAVALAVFVALLAISPGVREAVARFFGLDTVRIQFVATPPAPSEVPVTAAPDNAPSSQPALHLAGLTTFDEARARAKFSVRLPGYPPQLGQPQRVYLQDFGFGRQVILVYPDFALFESEGVIYGKGVGEGSVIQETTVAGQYALWLSGSPHIVQVESPDGSYREESARLIDGNVLAWKVDDITYRLETKLALDEAARIAESLYTPGEPAGLMSLDEARRKARFPIALPTYPADAGEPIRVYFQDFKREFRGAHQVILVYPDFTLYEAEGAIYQKSVAEATIVEEVKVGGRPGLWLTGASHIVQVRDASGEFSLDFRRVEGNVLAWEANGVTYRIETQLPLAEALRIAESIQ